ncbi:MAG: efflux RND transporter permease subunit [Thiobacillus sp.]|nr:efflux RND transporter permease subunit [Thiobacillus sp.]
MSPYARFITNHPLANVSFVVILLLGVLGYLAMPREQDPEINFNWLVVNTVLPGAAAEDVEKKVTDPLEEAIRTLPDIRFVSSTSRDNSSIILVRFREVSERQFDKHVTDLRRLVQNKYNSDLPDDAKEPDVQEITTSNGFPTAMVLLTGPADDERLRRTARQIQDDIERLPGVDRVLATGQNDPELRVEFSPFEAAARGLTAAQIADAVRAWFRDTFAGRARVGEDDWLVRVIGQQADADYLGRLTVLSPSLGSPVPLSTLATVETARARASSLASSNGQPAVILAVTKKSKVNTLNLVADINRYIAEREAALKPGGFSLLLFDDQTVPTKQAIGVMETNALIGLLIVLGLCWLFLGSRLAMLVSLGIPFSLAGAFAILYAFDFTLSIPVLLGIVIALGMLVDDAVVITEAIYYRIARGADALPATLDAIREVGLPVLAAVATTIAAFLPLMLMPGIVGKFMLLVPLVVTLALSISLLEAYWMMPAHVVGLKLNFRKPTRLQPVRERYTHTLRVKYTRLLVKLMRHPWVSGLVVLALFVGAVALVASGAVRTQFFAFDPIRLFYVNIDMPSGSAIDVTLRETAKVEAVVRRHLSAGEARGVTSYAGVKWTDTEPLYGESYGQVSVSLNPRGEGMREVGEVVDAMRQEIEALPAPGKISFTQLSGGPPAAKAIKLRLRGDDVNELRAAAQELKQAVIRIDGTRDVTDDDLPGRPQLVLQLDADALKSAGLDPATVARLVRLHTEGEIITETRDSGDKIEVRVRGATANQSGAHQNGASQDGLTDIQQLLADPVALPGGGTTTLGALVHAETRIGSGGIKHYNLKRAITIESDLDKERIDTVEANAQIAAQWDAMAARYPNTRIDFTGELDDINESLGAMKMLFLLGVGLIYLILAAQFRSYWQPLLILLTVPMAFTGVVFGLFITQNPLSLYTLYGVIALTGIAVNSAIVLIDAANARLQSGMGLLHATLYAARRRVVPIIITTTTTIGGLFSLAVGLGGKSLIWGPMAASLVWGLLVATTLTLFTMPTLFRLAMQIGPSLRGGLVRKMRRQAAA